MATVEIKASQIGVLADKTVIVKSSALVNALISDSSGTLTSLTGLYPSITLEQISVDESGNVIIANGALADAIREQINSAVAAAGDTNNGICF